MILGVLLSEIFHMVSLILKINEVRYPEYSWLIYIGFSIHQSQRNANAPAIVHKIQNNFCLQQKPLMIFVFVFVVLFMDTFYTLFSVNFLYLFLFPPLALLFLSKDENSLCYV